MGPGCTREDFDATRSWLNLEIFVFYTTFAGNFLFIFFSEFLLKSTGLVYLEAKGKSTDFLLRYQTMNGLYQTFFLLLFGNVYCIYRLYRESHEEGIVFKSHSAISINVLLWFITVVHIFQFVALKLQIFSSSNFRLTNVKCLSLT